MSKITFQFPLNLSTQLLPKGWKETKWTQSVIIRFANGVLHRVSIHDLIKAYAGSHAEFAGIDFINNENGRQLFFGLHPESKKGNQFSSPLYYERAGGGSNIVFSTKTPDCHYLVGLLDQERPTQDQSGKTILQIPGGYPIDIAGNTDEIHKATAIAEIQSEVTGKKYVITPDNLITIGSPHNTNNGTVLTGKGQGIATQLLMFPFELLIPRADGTYKLNPDRAEVADAKLERIYDERFHFLNSELIRKLHDPISGYAACDKTCMAIDRAFFYLILKIL